MLRLFIAEHCFTVKHEPFETDRQEQLCPTQMS